MYCSNCGNEISEGASFCSSCGAKIDDNANQSVVNNQQQTEEYQTQSETAIVKPKKKTKKGCIIPLVVFAVFIILFTVLVGVLSRDADNINALAIAGDLNEKQEAAMITVFEKCGLQQIVHAEMINQNEKYTEYFVQDLETTKFNENKDIDVWITNETKQVHEISYGGVIVYSNGIVEKKLPECYVATDEREKYWQLAKDAVSDYLLYPVSAVFYSDDECKFGIHTEDVFIQGLVVTSDSLGKSVAVDYQVNFEKRTNKIKYLMIDGVEYIT